MDCKMLTEFIFSLLLASLEPKEHQIYFTVKINGFILMHENSILE